MDVAPDLKSQASAASLESALSIAKLYDSQTSLARLSGASLGTRRSQHAVADAPIPSENSAPPAPAESADSALPLAPSDTAAPQTPAEASAAQDAADETEAAAAVAEVEEEAAGNGGGYLTGLLRYRAPMSPPQNGKLESFDRKIGRAANALRVRVILSHLACCSSFCHTCRACTSVLPVAISKECECNPVLRMVITSYPTPHLSGPYFCRADIACMGLNV